MGHGSLNFKYHCLHHPGGVTAAIAAGTPEGWCQTCTIRAPNFQVSGPGAQKITFEYFSFGSFDESLGGGAERHKPCRCYRHSESASTLDKLELWIG